MSYGGLPPRTKVSVNIPVSGSTSNLSQDYGGLDVLTVASIGIVACVAADMVHEALGHATLSWLLKDPIILISTVALQNADPNRAVSAAGTAANCIVGAISLVVFRRQKQFASWTCFLYLFAIFNLLNSGYLVVSAILNRGDWASVVSGLRLFWLWRILIGIGGAVAYYGALRWLADVPAQFKLGPESIRQVVLPAYFAGGVVMTLASVFNPFSSSLILMSGVGASFGLNAGMLFIPSIMQGSAGAPGKKRAQINWSWVLMALVCAGVFTAVFGPGIRFRVK